MSKSLVAAVKGIHPVVKSIIGLTLLFFILKTLGNR